MEFRLLRADEIEARIGTCNAKGVSILLYKDARCDMQILDETVGTLNWKREHSRDNKNCTVSLWDESKNQWVSKEDVGTESFTEAEKGLASDSFKRACVNIGIGRELYTAPFIWFSNGECQISGDSKYPKCTDKFEVTSIEYADRNIKSVTVIDLKTGTEKKFSNKVEPKIAKASDEQIKQLIQLIEKSGHKVADVASRFKWDGYSPLDSKTFNEIVMFVRG